MLKTTHLKQSLTYLIIFAMIGLLSLIILIIGIEFSLPSVRALQDIHLQEPLRVFTRDNKLIAEFGEIRRTPVNLKQVPPGLIAATLATEDQRFYSHTGVDLLGLSRAAVVLITTGEKKQGGSTITMQVARNYFLTRKKTYTRKLREILLALKIDHLFTKEKILELYFNKVFYGNRAYGIASAAQIYYGKHLNELTLSQMAMLAGLPKAPSILNPLANSTAAKARRNFVLHRMLTLKYIGQETYNKAIVEPITAKYHGVKISVKAPYVAEMVRQLMINQFGGDVYNEGYNVYTTIDSKHQSAANQALNRQLLAYDKRHGYRTPEKNLGQVDLNDVSLWLDTLKRIPTINALQPAIVISMDDTSATALLKNGEIIMITWSGLAWARKQLFYNDQEYLSARPKHPSDILKIGDIIRVAQRLNKTWALTQIPKAEAALVALNPDNGAILALDGGFNYYNSKFNRILQAHRQPGSSFKPFIYSAALAKHFTLSSIINDAPVVLRDSGENSLWRPENDTQKFYGPTRLKDGLIKSRNLVSIRLLQLIGVQYAIDYVTRFGFKRDQLPHGLSLALGTATVTPLELAEGYAVFANGGYQVKSYLVDQIVNSKRKTIFRANPRTIPEKKSQDDKDDLLDSLQHKKNIALKVITPQNAYLITNALQDVIKKGTGRAALVLHRHDLAGKTGTTNDKHDVWFSGYNHHLVATVWMGFDKPQPLYEYAAHTALPLWIDFMKQALHNEPEATSPQPPGMVTVRIDKKTGLLASANDKNALFEVFREKYTPTHYSTQIASNRSDVNSNSEPLY